MSAVLSVAGEGGPPVGTGIVIAAVFALIATLVVTVTARERRHFSELLQYAEREDWHPVSDPAGLPPIVTDALFSKRSKLFRRFRTMPLWVSWHQWTEISRGGAFNDSTQRWESRTSTTTHDLTRYFVALPGTYPEMTIERRPRPDPSGPRPFDRRFKVMSGDGRAGDEISDISVNVPQRLAEALLAQTVPPFMITSNVLIVRYEDRPTRANLSMRADEVRRLTLLLTPSRQNGGQNRG
ncbi:MAG TPA: hypothetical protein VFC19_30065 [Candidatus Limnocylindrales bacterium]|nr:hypothetical protein [Candidatus Limnocylindrales bacterium]